MKSLYMLLLLLFAMWSLVVCLFTCPFSYHSWCEQPFTLSSLSPIVMSPVGEFVLVDLRLIYSSPYSCFEFSSFDKFTIFTLYFYKGSFLLLFVFFTKIQSFNYLLLLNFLTPTSLFFLKASKNRDMGSLTLHFSFKIQKLLWIVLVLRQYPSWKDNLGFNVLPGLFHWSHQLMRATMNQTLINDQLEIQGG